MNVITTETIFPLLEVEDLHSRIASLEDAQENLCGVIIFVAISALANELILSMYFLLFFFVFLIPSGE